MSGSAGGWLAQCWQANSGAVGPQHVSPSPCPCRCTEARLSSQTVSEAVFCQCRAVGNKFLKPYVYPIKST